MPYLGTDPQGHAGVLPAESTTLASSYALAANESVYISGYFELASGAYLDIPTTSVVEVG